MRLILATLGLISLNLAYASDNVYQYTDKNGMTVYTNKPVKNSKKLDLPALSVYAAPVTLNDYSAKGYFELVLTRLKNKQAGFVAAFGAADEDYAGAIDKVEKLIADIV